MKKLLIAGMVLLISGCATMPYQPYAREVKKRPRKGGVIALHGDYRPEDRSRAEFLMSSNCGDNQAVNVTEEGEVVVGESTHTSSNRSRENEESSGFHLGGIGFVSGNPNGVNTDTQSQTTQMKEWQIAYDCVAMNDPVKRKKR